jgi:hypothetical protein
MNLHALVSPIIGVVNPNKLAVLMVSSGYVVLPSYGRTPTYRTSQVTAQIQAMAGSELSQLDGLNLNRTRRGIYLYGEAKATERVSAKGGDLVVFPQGQVARTWLVDLVLEQWAGWCKVSATLQDDKMSGVSQAFGNNLDTNALITLSSAGANTITSADQVNANYKGLILVINLTTVTDATVNVYIRGKDAASGDYYNLFQSGTLDTPGLTALTMYPGVLSTGDSYPQPLSATWGVQVLIANNGGNAVVTGTVGASLLQ